MPILSLVVASALQAASPAVASPPTLVDPERVLSDLRDRGDWRQQKAVWDNRGLSHRDRWNWELKITYGVRSDGRLMNCAVVSSSGYDDFDRAACPALLAKARVAPRVDGEGRAVRSSGEVAYRMIYQPMMGCLLETEEYEGQ